MADIITYETLFEILQKEKLRMELQKLDINFHENFIKYLEEKTSILNSQKSKNSIFSQEIQKTERQLENIKRIMKELYERRERKVIEAALFYSRNPKKNLDLEQAMLSEEKDLFNRLTNNLKDSREKVLTRLLEGKKKEDEKTKNVLIKFISPVPKFVGADNFVYGPFEKEDISVLPEQISNLLVNKKRAEKLDIKQ